MITLKGLTEKVFATKEDSFKWLKENKDLIISAKKAEIYKSCEKGLSVITNQKSITKISESVKSFEMNPDYYYFVVNSSNILDSHTDMHIEGNWEKTIKEQQGKVYLVFDHELKRTEIIAMKQNIEIFTAIIPFKLLGKDYEGDSYCLIYKVKKTAIENEDAKKWLEKEYSFEASVRMQYMDIELCIDSKSSDMAKEKENFDLYYPLIANKEDFEEITYLFAIKQARNVQESSLVMFGSNPATGLLTENTEPVKSTPENIEPPPSTQSEQKELLNLNFY